MVEAKTNQIIYLCQVWNCSLLKLLKTFDFNFFLKLEVQ